jgi:lysyl-tRNA synthetase class 2
MKNQDGKITAGRNIMIKNQTIKQTSFRSLNAEITTAGRIVSFRRMGNVSFGHIQDATGSIQVCFRRDDLGGTEAYKSLISQIIIGCHIQIQGKIWDSSTGERSILVFNAKVLNRPIKGIPSAFYGVEDEEIRFRKRYLETSISVEAAEVFRLRSKVISTIRHILEEDNFLEVETPMLTAQASGAIARPFVTHHNALGKDLYLRIAPETHLKMMMVGGFDKIFELNKSFRNEGLDRSHLQEFDSIEWYWAYADYQDNKSLFNYFIGTLLIRLGFQRESVKWGEYDLDFTDIPTVKYRDLFLNAGLPSPDSISASDADEIFKKQIRPNLIQPIYVEDYPAHMSPMAARKSDDPSTVEQWQLIVGGWEIVKCYTELVDPILQRTLLEEQAAQKAGGNEEAMMLDEAFLEALEYGCPPCSGLGMGIERLICILANKKSLRDVTFFPMMG